MTAESAKLVKAVGVRVRTVAPARSAVPVADSAVAGTRPTVRTAPVPRLTTCRGVWASAAGTVLTNLMVLAGAFLRPETPRSVTVSRVSGTALMESTVRSDTWLTVCGTTPTPLTAVSGETTLIPLHCLHYTNQARHGVMFDDVMMYVCFDTLSIFYLKQVF